MKTSAPILSVIIPTHNRVESVRRTLDSLCAQTFPSSSFEVVVVADGCLDATAELVARYPSPFSLQLVQTTGCGAAIARNRGASRSSGRLLLFLDDDIEAGKTLLEAHIQAHENHSNAVVIGYLPPAIESRPDFFRMALRLWWEDQFQAMRRPGHRFTYRDLLSGNFSLSAELFQRIGGFDEDFRCREDYELGFRLIQSGAQFCFAPKAFGFHYDKTDLSTSLKRAFDEGKADVRISRRHPELRWALPLSHVDAERPRLDKVLLQMAFDSPRLGDALAGRLRLRLDFLEALRLRARWRPLYASLRGYSYWRGVAEELGSRRALANFLQSAPIRRHFEEIEIDLRNGFAAGEKALDSARPESVLLRYGENFLGRIPGQIGAERLRGTHLRPYLAKHFSSQLLVAVTLEQTLGSDPLPEPDLQFLAANQASQKSQTISEQAYAH